MIQMLMSLLLVASAASAVNIIDPNGALDRLASQMPKPEFAQAVTCPKLTNFYAHYRICDFRCTNLFCRSQCEEIEDQSTPALEMYQEECSTESAFIFTDSGYTYELTRTEHEQSGHWLISFLDQIENYARPVHKIVVSRVSPRTYTFRKDGVATSEQGYLVEFEFYPNDARQSKKMEIAISKERHGVDQLIYFADEQFFSGDPIPYFLKREGLVDPRRGGFGSDFGDFPFN